jgi:hypothetical protein
MLAIPSAWLWATTPRASTRAAGIGLLVLSLMTTATLVSVDSGRLAFNVRDGYARGAEWMNALVDVPLALPSFFRHTPQVAAARAAVWIAFMAAAVLALRGLERRTDPRSSFALALPLAFAVAVMGAVSTVWALDGVTPVKPDDSQMSVLTDYDVGVRPTGVDISHGRIETAGALVSTLAIATPTRRAPVPARTLLLVPSIVPAGEYELRIAPGAEVSGEARLVIGREARPSKTWNLATEFHDGAAELRLPATVGSLSILGDHAPPGALTLHPKRLWGGKARLSPDFARRVERYGPATVFFYDTEAFPEVPGFWVKGGRTASMAVALEDRSAHARIFLRNAAAINRVSLEVDGDEQVLDLQPGEERQMNLPMADGRPGALIRIESASGFRPIDVDPASRDSRYLGVWVEFR